MWGDVGRCGEMWGDVGRGWERVKRLQTPYLKAPPRRAHLDNVSESPFGRPEERRHPELVCHLQQVVNGRSHQRSSEVIRGHQRSSEVIRGHQRSSEVIRGH